MKTETYLDLVRRLNVLIDNEQLEKENLFTIATKTTQDDDGMPHAPGVSDKVGNISVKILMKEQEIDHMIDTFVDLREEIKAQIRTLPTDECDVLYKYYVLNWTLAKISDERIQSIDWIKKLKWRGISKIKVLQSEAFKEACKLLKF